MCATCGCSHLELKLDARWWTLPLVGYLEQPEDETGPAELLELRNAPCHSTLARIVAERVPVPVAVQRGES